jgi:hypothetical protein
MAAMDDPELVVDAIISACLDPKDEMPVGWKSSCIESLSPHVS